MPELLTNVLAEHTYDPVCTNFITVCCAISITDRCLRRPQIPISTTVRRCASDFKRTHQDTWHEDSKRFNEHQLAALSTLLTGSSYCQSTFLPVVDFCWAAPRCVAKHGFLLPEFEKMGCHGIGYLYKRSTYVRYRGSPKGPWCVDFRCRIILCNGLESSKVCRATRVDEVYDSVVWVLVNGEISLMLLLLRLRGQSLWRPALVQTSLCRPRYLRALRHGAPCQLVLSDGSHSQIWFGCSTPTLYAALSVKKAVGRALGWFAPDLSY